MARPRSSTTSPVVWWSGTNGGWRSPRSADSAARPQAMAADLVHRPFRCRASRALRQRAIDLRGGVMGGSKATVDHPAQARHAAGGAADYLSTMSPAGSPAETIDRVVGEVEGLQVRRR